MSEGVVWGFFVLEPSMNCTNCFPFPHTGPHFYIIYTVNIHLYTRMLRKALNVSWRQHMTNEELYKNLQNVSKKIAARRLRLAGHCLRYPEEIASHLVLWQPTIGSTSRGRKATTFVNTLKRDTYLDSIQEIKTAAMDRRTWNSIVKSVRARARP